ncbi:PREDICTED: ankyrin repeat domain-containing protein 20A2 [Rhinopithecus bieti]|uniref:ankyrin repeat domain-containing protein 20A2 n=1 Tax=Rhinopithecus bieti TaxID=61621 RepID=UPI00083BB646|nr:PREDICTED: ankyrin repeat domain-containing protein 20A2 [Rhinopithecus bieti]
MAKKKVFNGYFCVTDSVPRTCVDVAYGAQDPLALPAPKAEQLHGDQLSLAKPLGACLHSSRKSLAGCVCWQVECCLERKSRDVDAVDKQHSSVSPRKCQSLYLDLPMKKGNSIVNGKGEGPPDKHSSLKPSTEMEDPAMKGAVQRKNVQTLRAEQDILVASEEDQESLERSEKKQPQLSLKHAL